MGGESKFPFITFYLMAELVRKASKLVEDERKYDFEKVFD